MRRGKPVTWRGQEKKAGGGAVAPRAGEGLTEERFSAGGRPDQSFASRWCGSHRVGQVAGGEGLKALPLGHNSSGAREKSQASLFLCIPSTVCIFAYITFYTVH